MNRRNFLGALPFLVAGCSQIPTSPTQEVVTRPLPPTTPQPQPVPRAELTTPTGRYVYEIATHDNIASVAEALQIAGLTLDVQDKGNWTTTSGQVFSGGLVRGIKGPSDPDVYRGNWLIQIQAHRLCQDVRHQSVAKDVHIGCYLDDRITDASTCA